VKQTHRVVGRLSEPVHDARPAAGLQRSGDDGILEHLHIDNLRAGEGKEDSSGLNLFQGEGIEALVALYSVVPPAQALGEGRRIYDNQVLFRFRIAEKRQDIRGEGPAAIFPETVERSVAVGQIDGFL
jgi:hypothetical protein